MKQHKFFSRFIDYLPYLICAIFFFAYTVLSLVKHNHFLTGYDLGVEDQGVWSYSQLKNPLSTSHAYAFTPIYYDHVEVIYLLVFPLYWIWDDVQILIVSYVLAIVVSAIPLYLLAKKKKLPTYLCLTILISYLSFYGVQNAIWADVHSIGFGVCFLSWFLYFLYTRQLVVTSIFFLLAISAKEDIALLTLMISLLFFYFERKKYSLVFAVLSLAYLLFIYLLYFPHIVPGGYRFQSSHGLLSDLNPLYMINTSEKRDVLFYSIAGVGFLPLLSPVTLLPFLGDLAHFFILGNSSVTSAQGMFMHYRITIALLLLWPSILILEKYKRLQHPLLAFYLITCTLVLQYTLHLPLSYLTKSWFWQVPQGAITIPHIIASLPKNVAIVSQNNITPHLSHREYIFTLWPEKKEFKKNSPCGEQYCHFFHWVGNPKYLIVDTSSEFDIRHFLANREEYLSGLENLEKTGVVRKEQTIGTTTVYKVLKNPSAI